VNQSLIKKSPSPKIKKYTSPEKNRGLTKITNYFSPVKKNALNVTNEEAGGSKLISTDDERTVYVLSPWELDEIAEEVLADLSPF